MEWIKQGERKSKLWWTWILVWCLISPFWHCLKFELNTLKRRTHEKQSAASTFHSFGCQRCWARPHIQFVIRQSSCIMSIHGDNRRIRLPQSKRILIDVDLLKHRFRTNELNAAHQFVHSVTSQDIFDDPFVHYTIHGDWLKDSRVIRTYRQAILDSRYLFRGKIVLDVNCGIGLLSMFAIRAGAKHVYAIDSSGAAKMARLIVNANNLADSITVIQGNTDDIRLPVDQVDIIVTMFRWWDAATAVALAVAECIFMNVFFRILFCFTVITIITKCRWKRLSLHEISGWNPMASCSPTVVTYTWLASMMAICIVPCTIGTMCMTLTCMPFAEIAWPNHFCSMWRRKR